MYSSGGAITPYSFLSFGVLGGSFYVGKSEPLISSSGVWDHNLYYGTRAVPAFLQLPESEMLAFLFVSESEHSREVSLSFRRSVPLGSTSDFGVSFALVPLWGTTSLNG